MLVDHLYTIIKVMILTFVWKMSIIIYFKKGSVGISAK